MTPMPSPMSARPYYPVQRGFALISALIFLLLMTLVALSVTNMTTIEEKMARNFRDRDLAFSAAEAALRDAKTLLSGGYRWPYTPLTLVAFSSGCTNGLCEAIYSTPNPEVVTRDFFAAGSTAREYGDPYDTLVTNVAPPITGVVNQPRYMIEAICTNKLGDPPCDLVYRITAQAQGRLATTRVTLQEVFRPTQKLQ